MRHTYGKQLATCVAALLVVASAVGCKPPPFRSTQGTWTVGTITRDGSDRYEFVDKGAGLRVTAPSSNRGSNLRVVAVKNSTATSADQTSCVTWDGPVSSKIQPGIVLRAQLEADRTRAIMVTNNIWVGARPVMNVHLADTNASPAYTQIAALNLSGGLGPYQDLNPLPWRFCARVAGSTVTVKAWSIPAHPAEPSWTDPTYTAAVRLPTGAVSTGKPGVYLGHLMPGETNGLSAHSACTN